MNIHEPTCHILVTCRVSGNLDSVINPQFLTCSQHIPNTFLKILDMFLMCSQLCVLVGLEWDSWHMHIHDLRPITEKALQLVRFNLSMSQTEAVRERLLIFSLWKWLRTEALRWPVNGSEIILGTWIWVSTVSKNVFIFWCIQSWMT